MYWFFLPALSLHWGVRQTFILEFCWCVRFPWTDSKICSGVALRFFLRRGVISSRVTLSSLERISSKIDLEVLPKVSVTMLEKLKNFEICFSQNSCS